MTQGKLTGSVNSGILEQIEQVVQMNVEDAERLIALFRESGDTENLQKAIADLEKWERKADSAGKNGNA